MTKAIVVFVTVFASAIVHAGPVTLNGYDVSTKETCSLTIDEWSFELGQPMDWYGLRLKVRSSYRPDRQLVTIQHSASPFVLHGALEYDVFAVQFRTNEMSPEGIYSFMFQTWEEEKGLFQASCRIK